MYMDSEIQLNRLTVCCRTVFLQQKISISIRHTIYILSSIQQHTCLRHIRLKLIGISGQTVLQRTNPTLKNAVFVVQIPNS